MKKSDKKLIDDAFKLIDIENEISCNAIKAEKKTRKSRAK